MFSMRHFLRHLGIILFASLLAACASSNSGSIYTREETRTMTTVKIGVVESVRAVKIEGTNSQIGTAAGAVVGGVAGSSVGEGKGSIIGAVIGAVAGGLAGSAIEEIGTRTDGVEITVKLDNGNLVAIVQETDETFHPGEKVRILESGGVTRVSH